MTNQELYEYVSRALVVAESHKNLQIINALTAVQDWLNGSSEKPDINILNEIGTKYNYPRLIQLHTWILEHELT